MPATGMGATVCSAPQQIFEEGIVIIGDRLREIRKFKNLSQGDVEKRCGLFRCYISRVESSVTVPSIETLEKFARALEVPLYQIFYDGNNAKALRIPAKSSKGPKLSAKETRLAENVSNFIGRMRPRDRELLLIMARKLAQTS
jgi:transcriptional regulator with XRE-family HTH domain